MNNLKIISFDIEEWFIEKYYLGDRKEKYLEYDRYLNKILDLLDERHQKATFMCVGDLAASFPYVIKTIVDRGHEIGCHSNKHVWLTKLTEKQLRADTYSAISALEDVAGEKVRCYRAPAFSINEHNKYALEILIENGIEIDSSIFPATRDFGGFSSFGSEVPTLININGHQLKEFPICTTKIITKRIAYSGGGYFRFFPLSYIKKQMGKTEYAISYFHIGDLVNLGDRYIMSKEAYETYFKEPGLLHNRIKRAIKSNWGISGAFDKMCSLVKSTDFVSLGQATQLIDWSKCPTIDL
jgi:polysaccharide deacetylase family protein (PEP-CTERM system associated)